MKTLFIFAAGTLLLGQTAPQLGLPLWLGGVSNLSAISLMGFLFYRLILVEMPRERKRASEAAATERTAAREHTERVVDKISEEHRRDREQWAARHYQHDKGN